MKKRILIIASVVVVVIVCLWAAIGVYRRMEAFLDPQGAALNYMEKKYGEEFTMVFYGDDLMGSPTTDMYVSPVAHPEWQAYIMQDKKTGKYSDNYVAFLFKPEVESWYQKLAEPIYGSCKVFCSISTASWPNYIRLDSPIKDIIDANIMGFTIFTDIPQKDKDIKAQALMQGLKQNNINPTFYILYTNSKLLNEITTDNADDYFASKYFYTRLDILVPSDYEKYKWKEGSLRD